MSLEARMSFRAALVAALLVVIAGAVWSGGDAAPSTTGTSSGTNDAATASQSHLSRSRASCVGSPRDPGGPDPWGGCWPGPRNTGVPAGTALTPISGDRIVTKAGAVVSGWDVEGCIAVSALNVTIENSRARCVTLVSNSKARYCHYGESDAARNLSECTLVPGLSDDADPETNNPRLTVRDSEINCRGVPGATGTGLGDRNLTVVRVDIQGCENAFDADSYVSIEDSYIHDLYNSAIGDPHTDGLQSAVGLGLRLTHNVIYAFTSGCIYPDEGEACNGTSAIGLGTAAHRSVIRRNLLAGGAYTVYCPQQQSANRLRILQNRFSEVYSPNVGEYGPMTGCGRAGITRKGNKRIHY